MKWREQEWVCEEIIDFSLRTRSNEIIPLHYYWLLASLNFSDLVRKEHYWKEHLTMVVCSKKWDQWIISLLLVTVNNYLKTPPWSIYTKWLLYCNVICLAIVWPLRMANGLKHIWSGRGSITVIFGCYLHYESDLRLSEGLISVCNLLWNEFMYIFVSVY